MPNKPTIINENSSHTLIFNFRDESDAALVPDTVTYRIDCLTTGEEIQADADISPASDIELRIDGSKAIINDETNRYERRRVFVTATYGTDEMTGAAYYSISNLNWAPPA